MSEKIHVRSGEELRGSELSKEARERSRELKEQLEERAEREGARHEQAVESARREVEAVSGREQAPRTAERESTDEEPVTRGHKKMTYRATMRRVEGRLSAPERAFSRFINAPVVDQASAVAGRTVARPSGVLGGAVVAFLGMLFVTYYAKELGFALSGAEFIVLLAAGWAVGLAAEFAWRLLRSPFKH